MEQNPIGEVRAFNRFYTRIIGLVEGPYLHSSWSLPEVRVMFEIHHHGQITAREIIALLQIDKGYLSRMIRRFENAGLIVKSPATGDGRSILISLSPSGMALFSQLNAASSKQIATLMGHLSPEEIQSLTNHMKAIEILLSKKS